MTQPNPEHFLLSLPIILYIACLPAALAPRRAQIAIVSALTSLASATTLWAGLACLLSGHVISVSLRIPAPLLGGGAIPWFLTPVEFSIDPLSAVFLTMLGLVGLAASIYSYGYLRILEDTSELRMHSVNYPLLLLFMYLVVVTRNLFLFLVFWELVALTSQFLVSLRRGMGGAVRAGLKYFTLSKGFAEFLVAGGVILMVVSAGSDNYGAVAAALRSMQASNPALVLVAGFLMLAGLMVKASLVPLHVWAPDAYSEAPSNVSALLSGAASKLGIYMMFRLLLYFITPTLTWGVTLALTGTVTLVYGTLMALKQTDGKRLLAYHSVGQLGYVTLGLGACVTLLSVSPPHPLLASVAMFASLYHAMNHAFFKSLLFLNAGSVEYVTGSRDMDVLGGLGKVMPLTAVTALIASFSIAGVPPFNGFVSKWLLYSSTMPVAGFLPACGFLAMFISSVTTASFMKFYTSVFGKPSKKFFSGVREVPSSMLAAQLTLATACVALGVVPGLAWFLIKPALLEAGLSTSGIQVGVAFVAVKGISSNFPALMAAVLFPTAGILYVLARRSAPHTLEVTWACGASRSPNAMAPTARSYYEVFEEEFPWPYRVGEALHEYVVVKGGRCLNALLSRAQWVLERPSLMASISAYVAALFLVAALLMVLAGVVRP